VIAERRGYSDFYDIRKTDVRTSSARISRIERPPGGVGELEGDGESSRERDRVDPTSDIPAQHSLST
jgi:hypothetical protein